ncbi:MAG: hypothetical protein JST68_31705 [Bacteroidetes bacterium]|nr:hypothetical protein [Bacteroidota bacterium]
MRRTVYGIFILILLVSGCKSSPGPSLAKADVSISAAALAHAFENNERVSDSLYLYKVVSVRGIVEKVMKRESGGYVVTLGGKIDCSLDTLYNRHYLSLRTGDSVTLRGTCGGRLLNVILMQCIIEK